MLPILEGTDKEQLRVGKVWRRKEKRTLPVQETLLVGFNSQNVAAGSVHGNKKKEFWEYLKDMLMWHLETYFSGGLIVLA